MINEELINMLGGEWIKLVAKERGKELDTPHAISDLFQDMNVKRNIDYEKLLQKSVDQNEQDHLEWTKEMKKLGKKNSVLEKIVLALSFGKLSRLIKGRIKQTVKDYGVKFGTDKKGKPKLIYPD